MNKAYLMHAPPGLVFPNNSLRIKIRKLAKNVVSFGLSLVCWGIAQNFRCYVSQYAYENFGSEFWLCQWAAITL